MQDVFERNDELSIAEAGFGAPRDRRGSGNRRLAITAAVIGAVLLGLGGGLEVANRHSAGIPVITADTRPIRVRPDNPGGLQVIGANEGAPDAGAEAMAPPPEAPDTQALHAQQQAELATRAQQAEPPVPAAAMLARTGSAAPDVPLPPSVGASQDRQPAAAASPPPAPRTIAPTPARATVAAPEAGGHHIVQLASVGSEDAANSEWTRLSKRMPDLLGDRHPEIVRFEHDGHTFFRLRTGGFADTADATAFCGRVRAKGGNCAAF